MIDYLIGVVIALASVGGIWLVLKLMDHYATNKHRDFLEKQNKLEKDLKEKVEEENLKWLEIELKKGVHIIKVTLKKDDRVISSDVFLPELKTIHYDWIEHISSLDAAKEAAELIHTKGFKDNTGEHYLPSTIRSWKIESVKIEHVRG